MQLPLFEYLPLDSELSQTRVAVQVGHARPLHHNDNARNRWITPSFVIECAVRALGAIDLDPCSTPTSALHVPARQYYSMDENSLSQPWIGRIWLNPPSGRAIAVWIDKLCNEYENGDVTAAAVLVPARSDTQWWQRLSVYPYCAVRGRVPFVHEDGKRAYPTFPSAVVYLGPLLDRFVSAFSTLGPIYMPYGVSVVTSR